MSDDAFSGEVRVEPRDVHELWALLESSEDLPTLPEVAVRLQKVVDDDTSGAKDVAHIIEDDPAIATKVLKVVNSSFYVTEHGEITQLQPAIARLGFLTVVNIALSTSVFGAFAGSSHPVFDRKEFWRHSISVGIIASVLHDYSEPEVGQPLTRDVVHLAGIVHDMGKVLFERYANTEFHAAIASARKFEIPALKEECRFVGMGHDEVGAWLAHKWRIGGAVEAAVRWHHDPLSCPDASLRPLVKLVHIADYICHNQELGESGNPCPSYDHRVREELNLSSDKIGQIMARVQVEAAKSDVLMSVTD